ncbi:MAG: hypothetical protein WBA41_16495 [Rivularia sp. (in: cyanobacteria)]
MDLIQILNYKGFIYILKTGEEASEQHRECDRTPLHLLFKEVLSSKTLEMLIFGYLGIFFDILMRGTIAVIVFRIIKTIFGTKNQA